MIDRFAVRTAEEYADLIPTSWVKHHGKWAVFQPTPMGITCRECHGSYRATNDYEQERLSKSVMLMMEQGDASNMLCLQCLAKRG